MIQVKDLQFAYNGCTLLKGLNLQVKEGELHGIIGPNGAGKSTLLRLIAGLLKPASGSILLENKPAETYTPKEKAKILSFVFQENYTGFPFTVREMVLMGRHPHQTTVMSDSREDQKIADECLDLMGMSDYRDREFRSLSGGEKQRAAIASVLAQQTPVILFDEPTAYTDIHFQSEIYSLVHRITREKKLTSLVVTHDINLASLYCDKVSVLTKGEIPASGPPNEVLTEEILTQTYNSALKVINHPDENVPLVIPISR